MNNVIFLHPQLKTPHEHKVLPSGLNYSAFHTAYLQLLRESATELNVSLQSNPYANVLYDSIWAFALTLNGSVNTLMVRNLSLASISNTKREIMNVFEEQLSKLSFQGSTGLLNFSLGAAALQISIELFQFQSGQPVKIGSYDSSLDQLLLNESALGEIPSDRLNRVSVLFPIPLTVFLSVLIVLCFVLTSVSMCLFIYYRKQPVIKATSSTLTLCLFVGCYLLLMSSLFHTVNSATSAQGSKESFRAFICSFNIYFTGIGLDIVLSTVIAKTLRIYHIFNKFGDVDPPQICYDQGLFFLILIIVSVKIVLLILWTCLDVNHLIDKEQYISHSVPPYFLVTEECQSNHLGIWLALYFGYSAVLMFIMVLLAVLTRKVKQHHFKDSKQINSLVAILFFIMCVSVPLWSLLRITGATILSKVTYTVGYTMTAFFCQVVLILPKIAPLISHSRQ